MPSPGFDNAVRRLAQYRPFSNEGRDLRAVLRDLVLAATAEADVDGVFDSLAACQEAFKTLWGLDVEIEELRRAVDDLVTQGMARHTDGGFALTAETLSALHATREDSINVRSVAFGEWEEHVRTDCPDLSDKQFEELTADLEAWLERIIARHGVEAALVLYPENPRAKAVFDAIEGLGDDFLPNRDKTVMSIRLAVLSDFVKRPTAAQRRFLADRLDVSYFLTVLSLDPAAGRLVQENVAGHRVYLDTNVLYAALGLAKPQEALSTLRLLDLTRAMGYELAVTPWTVDELRTSLARARKRVGGTPLPRRELADLLASQSDEKSVVAAFWAAYRDRGTQPNDFFDFYDHFETLLDGHGVKVVKEGVTAIDQRQDEIGEQLVLLDRQMGEKWKEDPVLEHDAKHRLLIERLRGDGHLTFSNARYWFLTRDGKLPPYALSRMDGATVELPFCVATSAWLQVMRSFTPRTDDLDRTVIDLLASPFVTVRRGVPTPIVEEVVGRVDQAEQGDAKLASAVLTDTALVASIGKARDKAERAKRVDRAFEIKTSELRERAEQAVAAEADAQAVAAKAQRQVEEEAAALELERKQRRILEAELERQKREHKEDTEALQQRLGEEAEARKEAEDTANRRIREGEAASHKEIAALASDFDQFKTLLRRVLAGCIGVLAVGVAGGLVIGGIVASPMLLVATITAAVLIAVLAMRYGVGKRKGDAVIGGIAFVITVTGFVWFVVDEIRESRAEVSPSSSEGQSSTPAGGTGSRLEGGR